MTSILQISDDALFVVLHYTTPLDFLSLSQTCVHFHNVSETKTSQMNKYWQQQCELFWSLIKKNNYKPTSFNYKFLFESMVNFIALTDEKDDSRVQAYKMKITLNDIFLKKREDYTLKMIIKQDNLEMFKICTCNMNDDINSYYIHSNSPFESKSILFIVITSKPPAIQIANYLLAPVEMVIPWQINDHDQDHDENNINTHLKSLHNEKLKNLKIEKCYNFPKIDVSSPEDTPMGDTPLTIASYYKHVEIVSLLINHPNMTKNGINKGNLLDITPLHGAVQCRSSVEPKDVEEDAVIIAQMLLNDERTNPNQIGGINQCTPLMDAIKRQPKVAQLLIDNNKVDVNIRSCNLIGGTALHVAIETIKSSQDETMKNTICQLIKQLLSRKDFDKNIKNMLGQTGLHLAKGAQLSQVVNILKLDNDNYD